MTDLLIRGMLIMLLQNVEVSLETITEIAVKRYGLPESPDTKSRIKNEIASCGGSIELLKNGSYAAKSDIPQKDDVLTYVLRSMKDHSLSDGTKRFLKDFNAEYGRTRRSV